jgi:hypothetical protein
MATASFLGEPGRVDEPRAAQEFSDVLTQVAMERRAVIVRRNGADLAAVIPLEYLELLHELLERADVEKLAAQIDWRIVASHPPQSWFDDDDNPFEPEKEPAS